MGEAEQLQFQSTGVWSKSTNWTEKVEGRIGGGGALTLASSSLMPLPSALFIRCSAF